MKTFRVVLFADTHLGFDMPLYPRVEQRHRGEDFFANYQRVLDHVLETRPDALVHGGDVFFRARVAPQIVNRAYAALAPVADAGIPVIIVPGNHDRSRLPATVDLPNRPIHVLNEPRLIEIEGARGTAAFSGFPFAWGDLRVAVPRHLDRMTVAMSGADFRFLCIHQTVAGARVGPHGYVFREGPDALPQRALPRTLTAVLAGHIHRSQVLEQDGCPPVFYPGSIERTSFAERNEAKGFFDLTFTAGASDASPTVQAQFLELPARPMLDVAIPGDLAPDQLQGFLRRASQRCHPDAIVRITTAAGLSTETEQALSAPTVRSCFPPNINVQLPRPVFNAHRR